MKKVFLLLLIIYQFVLCEFLQTNNLEVSLNGSNPTPATGNMSGQPKKKLFYMYDLGEEFWWRWPNNGTEKLCEENGYLSHEHAKLSAIGRPIRPEDGLFLTWHFSMFNSLYNRYKRSSRRTKNPEEASMFIIPYDIGLDGYMNAENCANRQECTGGLAEKLMRILSNSKYFKRYEGRDHVLLWSLGQYHPWPRGACENLMKVFCAKCSLSCYWMDKSKANNRFISIPFPAAYHWWDGIKNLPWAVTPETQRQRNLTAVYLGSTQTLNPIHTKIRRAVTDQCNASTHCEWVRLAHTSIDQSIGDYLSIYRKAVFCLCPPGDDPARKAVFDAIVSGCIPVIFELNTLYNQYPWHIGEQAALDISVYIPGGSVRSGKLDFMSVLLNIHPEIIRRKQIALAEVAPRVQYAIPPLSLLENRFDETVWDPPFADAAEIALDGFFKRTEHMVKNESTGIPHRLMSGREWGAEYDMVKVQVPTGDIQEKFSASYNAERSSLETSIVPLFQVLSTEKKMGVGQKNIYATTTAIVAENTPSKSGIGGVGVDSVSAGSDWKGQHKHVNHNPHPHVRHHSIHPKHNSPGSTDTHTGNKGHHNKQQP